MRNNEETVLIGRGIVLVPYRRQHVEKYHEWMSSEEIRQQTASEPLSLAEEYAMQQSWRLDDDKLTFIVLAKQAGTFPEGSQDVESFLQACPMVGDVNLFLSERHEEESDVDRGQRTDVLLDAELEVMIAEPTWRKKGLAMEALSLIIHYASAEPTPAALEDTTQGPRGEVKALQPLPLPYDAFLAKIGYDNLASLQLFAKLGFREVKRSEVWREVELRPETIENISASPMAVLRWPLPHAERDVVP